MRVYNITKIMRYLHAYYLLIRGWDDLHIQLTSTSGTCYTRTVLIPLSKYNLISFCLLLSQLHFFLFICFLCSIHFIALISKLPFPARQRTRGSLTIIKSFIYSKVTLQRDFIYYLVALCCKILLLYIGLCPNRLIIP